MDSPRNVVVIRSYRSGDEAVIRDIITEATMETVGPFFWSGVLSEVFPQVALLVMAFAFIGLGIPFKFCLVGIPVAVLLIYFGVWSAHLFKIDYDFLRESELDARGVNLNGLKKNIVGTVALTKSLHGGLKAWLRRMAVKKAYRRRGIASRLVDEVVQFCTDKCYEGIELVTTECHYQARELYFRKGFEAEHTYYKYYLNVRQPMYQFYLPLKPPKAELMEVASS
ncbi:uncharacterized protein LOC135222980 isoform X4 [Macrobrachium nipponense]|uniref:uncharacterized protein LOC135222980 isoform X4 n=1 Tax=Macrobrachium nipponense TaxID=159736 RepID=UPI0030C7ECA7